MSRLCSLSLIFVVVLVGLISIASSAPVPTEAAAPKTEASQATARGLHHKKHGFGGGFSPYGFGYPLPLGVGFPSYGYGLPLSYGLGSYPLYGAGLASPFGYGYGLPYGGGFGYPGFGYGGLY